MRAQGYSPFGSSPEQDIILDEMVSVAEEGTVGVFDLDGCLFDTRQRQVCIFREYASRFGFWELYAIREEHFVDWDLKKPLFAINMMMILAKAEQHYPYYQPNSVDGAHE